MKLFLAAFVAGTATTLISGQCLSDNDGRSVSNKDVKASLYAGQQEFTLSMLEQVNKVSSQENVFFSSYSVFHALLLAYFGSTAQTENSLRNVLRLNWTDNKIDVMHAYKTETSFRLQRAKNSSVEFRSADRLFFDQSVIVKECIEDLFVNEIGRLDFKGNPTKSAEAVNQWISQQTNNQIKDILSPGDLDDSTKAVLANAAYFKGDWASKFEPDFTNPEIFYTSTNQTFVPMMNKEATFNHGSNEILGAHILELPYLGEDTGISMFVFLPPLSVPNAMEKMLSNLNVNSFQEAINDLTSREVELKFPKFSFEKTLKLTPILDKMGVGDVFQGTANFSAFSNEHITFNDAIHKAKIIVNEEGSQAAAATVLFSFRSSRPLEPTQFFCNHPFLFVIYDHMSKAILFTGIYRGPEL